MSTQCNFRLNRDNAVYYSGETVSGTIILNTVRDKDVRNVRIVFLGEGKVKWSETRSTSTANGRSTSTTHYKSHIVYVNNETQVRGEGILPRGLHTYSFNIPLPLACPTSCEVKYGHIRYIISLIVNRPYRFNNIFQKPLTVLQTMDLNLNPGFRIPLVAEEFGYSSCCNCSDGQLTYNLRIPFGAYAPGQTVNYSLQIDNRTMTDTLGYTLMFNQKQTFIAKTPRHKERSKKFTLIQKQTQESCFRLSNRIFMGYFKIPPVAATTFDPNAIIKFEYKLKVTVLLPGCNSDTELKIPIVIGTIPLRESLPTVEIAQPSVSETANTTVPSSPPAPDNNELDLPPSYKDLNPPSFEEATRSDSPFVDTDAEEHQEVRGFRPLYPMYT